MNKIPVQKLSKETYALLQDVLEDEYKAFYFYRYGKNWFALKGFKIASDFCDKESDDESGHAKRLEKYIVDWNMDPWLPNVDMEDPAFENSVDFLNKAYDLEFKLYEKYEVIAQKLMKANDIGAWKFVQEFIQIQNDSVIEYSDKLNIAEGVNPDSKFEMLMIEEQLFG